MSDLISRQAAIRRYCGEHCGCEPQDCGLTMLQDGSEDCDFVRFLKEEPSRDIAPSAQPEQDIEHCATCIHSTDSKDICILRKCKYAIAELIDCYEPKQSERKKEDEDASSES